MDTTTATRIVPVLVRVHTRKDKTHFVSVKIPFKREGEDTKWVAAYFEDAEVERVVNEAIQHLNLTKANPYGYLGMAEAKGQLVLALRRARRISDLIKVEDIYTE